MTPAEKSAYQKGYNAGKRRTAQEDERVRLWHQEMFDHRMQDRRAFLDAVFCAALPACISQGRMIKGDGENAEREVKAAWWYANYAWKIRPQLD
jgi:hypothetical protein